MPKDHPCHRIYFRICNHRTITTALKPEAPNATRERPMIVGNRQSSSTKVEIPKLHKVSNDGSDQRDIVSRKPVASKRCIVPRVEEHLEITDITHHLIEILRNASDSLIDFSSRQTSVESCRHFQSSP